MKEAYYFPHDANARSDAKILELRAELGWEGYGLWWALVEQLREATDYRLSNEKTGGLAMGLGIPKKQLETLLALCFDAGLLALEDGYFFSPSLRRRMVALDNRRLARAESARNAAEKRWQKPADAPAMRTHGNGMPNAMPIDATIEETKGDLTKPNLTQPEETPDGEAGEGKKKIEEPEYSSSTTSEPESPDASASHTGGAADVGTSIMARPHAYDPAAISAALVLPFDTDAFRQMWAGYRQYREENKLRRYSGGMQEQEALRNLANLSGGDEGRAAEIISQTIRKGWKDLFKLDEPRAQHPQQHAVGAAKGQKPTVDSTVLAGSLAERRWEQRHGGAGHPGPPAGPYPGSGPAEPAGVRIIG